jgi:zona occludens toxin
MSFSPLPKEVFDLYKSSSLHTMKVRTPRIVWFGAALAAVAVVLAVAIPYRMHKLTKPMQVQQSVAAPASGSTSQSDSLRVRDFGKWMKPRVDGVPWSAPMFDHLEVQAKPRLYCIAADDGRCTCNTEQGTHYVVDLKVCRAIVADGLYNPFQPPPGGDSSPSDSHEQDASGSLPASRREAALPLVGSQASSVADVGASGGEKPRATALNYVPPTMGKWDPTPLPSGTGM